MSKCVKSNNMRRLVPRLLQHRAPSPSPADDVESRELCCREWGSQPSFFRTGSTPKCPWAIVSNTVKLNLLPHPRTGRVTLLLSSSGDIAQLRNRAKIYVSRLPKRVPQVPSMESPSCCEGEIRGHPNQPNVAGDQSGMVLLPVFRSSLAASVNLGCNILSELHCISLASPMLRFPGRGFGWAPEEALVLLKLGSDFLLPLCSTCPGHLSIYIQDYFLYTCVCSSRFYEVLDALFCLPYNEEMSPSE